MDQMILNSAGMMLIIISWAAQIMWMLKGRKEITAIFASLQMIGILLIVTGVMYSAPEVALLNMISALGASIVLVLLLKGEKKPVKVVTAAKEMNAAKSVKAVKAVKSVKARK
jgi:hypothetical protein